MGERAAVQEQISSLGSNILMVRPGQGFGRGGGGGESPPPFKMEDLDAIREQVGGVKVVAGQAQSSGTAIRNAQNWQTQINGTSNDYFIAQNWALSEGRLFTPAEEQAGKTVCIIGSTIVQYLFPRTDPLGQRCRI